MPHQVIKKMLLKMREELLSDISKSMRSESNPLKSEIGDLYDLATSERERELSFLLTDRDRKKLNQIDEALRRVEDGSYGICESCGEEISKGRLLAMPFTKLCVNCQAEQEKLEALEREYQGEGAYQNPVFTEEDET